MKLLLGVLPCIVMAAEVATSYQIVFLRPDPARKAVAKEEGERIQSAHMANIYGLAERGLLVAAGPFDDKVHTVSGVFFFKMDSKDSALREAAKDPTVLEHRNTVDVLSWTGPAGVGEEYRRLHKEDPKTPEGMGVHPFVMVRKIEGRASDDVVWRQHGEYLTGLRAAGKLMAAGPVAGDASVVEVLIFERIPDAEAGQLMAGDPAVKAGLATAETHRWWSAAHVFPR